MFLIRSESGPTLKRVSEKVEMYRATELKGGSIRNYNTEVWVYIWFCNTFI